MKIKKVFFVLASALMLASCSNETSTGSSSSTSAESEITSISSTSSASGSIFTLNKILAADSETGYLVQLESSKKFLTLSISETATIETDTSTSTSYINLPAGGTLTVSTISTQHFLNESAEVDIKNYLTFLEATSSTSLTISTGTSSLSTDGLIATFTFADGTTSYTITAASDLKLTKLGFLVEKNS